MLEETPVFHDMPTFYKFCLTISIFLLQSFDMHTGSVQKACR